MAVLRGKLQGFVEQGGHSAVVGGYNSSNKVQQSFPSTQVNVYLTGTVTHASIYSDSSGTIKANPFTAGTDGYWFFYADEGRYDITFSGTGITTPFTLSDVSSVSASSAITTFNVRDYGAVGDGVTDDRAAIVACIAACTASSVGSEVYFPPGAYFISSAILLTAIKAGITLRGAGMWLTSIVASAAGIYLFNVTPGSTANITIADMAFVPTSTNTLNGIYVGGISTPAGALYGQTLIKRCRFGAANYSNGINIDGAPNVTVRDSLFDGAGVPNMTGIYMDSATHNIRIMNNEFRYVNYGIGSFGSGSSTVIVNKDSHLIEGNRFDGGFYTGVETFSGGASATYAATTLTDLTQAFTAIDVGAYVRAMPIIRAGTASAIAGLKLTDGSATFTSAPLARQGYIVKIGTAFGIVSRVISATELAVEEWLSNTDRSRVVPPTAGSYTLYKVILGQVVSNTGTAITVGSWIDLDGTATTPSAGTHYELGTKLGNNMIQLGASTDNCQIVGNIVRRSLGDAIQTFGSYHTVFGNITVDCRDMGLSINGPGGNNSLVGNINRHPGTNGIVCSNSNGNTITSNEVEDSGWVAGVASVTSGGIAIIGSSRNNLSSNIIKRVTSVGLNYGIVIYSIDVSNPAGNNAVLGNRSISTLTTTPFIARGSSADNNKFLSNEGGTGFAQGWYDTSATNTRTNGVASQVWNPGAIANGAMATTAVFVNGAVLGTQASVGYTGITVGGWQLTAVGTAADTVTVTLTNNTGGPITPTGTLNISLIQP